MIKNLCKNFIPIIALCNITTNILTMNNDCKEIITNPYAMFSHNGQYMMHFLIAHNNKPPITRNKLTGKTVLHNAATEHDVAKLTNLISRYCLDDINTEDNNGDTPLHSAVEVKNEALTKLLIANKANLNIKNKNGKTPLITGIDHQSLECTILLLENGADPTIGKLKPTNYLVEFYGGTPLDEKVTESYKFILPVHATLLSTRLMPFYQQQQQKLALFAYFILQHYLVKDIRYLVTRKLLEVSGIPII